MEPISRIDIDLSRLDANLVAWRYALGENCDICPVVKADGYGLGMVPITRRLARNGVPLAAVYSLAQARQIVDAHISTTLLVLMPVDSIARTDPLYRSLVTGRLHLTIHSPRQFDRIHELGRTFGIQIPIHIQVDTGMARLGMKIEEADEILGSIARMQHVRLAGVYSHAASVQERAYTKRQLARFDALVEKHEKLFVVPGDPPIHFAGTGAALRDRRTHKTLARIGIGLFGYQDSTEEVVPDLESPLKLRPIFRWTSRIIHIHRLPPRASVGYDRTFKTRRKSRIGIVPVGYADGYPLALSNKAKMRVGPGLFEAPVVGRVNMDQLQLDLTDLPEDVSGIGALVEVISDNPTAPNALPELARLADSIPHEIISRLPPHIPRKYTAMPRRGIAEDVSDPNSPPTSV